MVSCLTAVCLLATGSAEGLSPPVPEKATVYFSNGGRIVSMKADGSERTVLTRKSAMPKNTLLGDHAPDLSPDGQHLLFLRVHREGEYGEAGEPVVMLADSDGSGASKLELSADYRYPFATWLADGRVLVSRVELKTRRPKSSLLAVNITSGVTEVLYTLKPVKDRIGEYPSREIADPAVSPDGTKVLFGLEDVDSPGSAFGLQLLDLDTGKSKTLDRSGSEGAWAPDGTEVVYSVYTKSRVSHEICLTDFECSNSKHLVIAQDDGSVQRRLTPDKGDARSPDWSADGSRILFQGNRNMPETAQAYEIYSIEPEGKCLTWLTNGAPASTDPAWSEVGGQETSADGCGDRGLGPHQEVKLPKLKNRPSLWLGETAGWRLLSGVDTFFGPSFDYSDCVYYQPGKCGAMFGTFNIPICTVRGKFAKSGVPAGPWSQRRGRPYFRSFGDGSRIDIVYSGKSLFYMMGEDDRSNADSNDAIRYLRVYGKKLSAGLPRVGVPRQDLRSHRRVIRVLRITGSAKITARRLGISADLVRKNHQMSKFLKRFGPVKPVSCPARSGSKSSSLRAFPPVGGPGG